MTQIINTWDQNVAAGGDRIAIYFHAGRTWHPAGWSVVRVRDGKLLVIDKTASRTDDRGAKFFYAHYPLRKGRPAALEEALTWIREMFGPREFVRNRMGDYVERDVNERFPLPRRTS